ncbi:MAG TPA: hypothetical protein VF861_04430 [Telluria sp.]
MKTSSLRKIFAGLLAVPLVGSTVMLWQAGDAAELWSSGAVLCLSLLLYAMFLLPAARPASSRRMRRREPTEPTMLPRIRMQ